MSDAFLDSEEPGPSCRGRSEEEESEDDVLSELHDRPRTTPEGGDCESRAPPLTRFRRLHTQRVS